MQIADYFQPRRAQLRTVREAVEGIADPEQAWRALVERALIPGSWVESPHRCYASVREHSTRPAPLTSQVYLPSARILPEFSPYPPSVAACVAFASDPRGIEQAEQLARELWTTLDPWFSSSRPRISRAIWAMVPRGSWTRPTDGAIDMLTIGPGISVQVAGIDPLGERVPAVHSVERAIAVDTWSRDAFEWCARHDVQISIDMTTPSELVGTRFSEIPNPFTPLVALWELGYALDAFLGDAAVLVGPLPE